MSQPAAVAMPYRGKPSRGCQRCRAKKVKCDELKPTCQRCQKAGQACHYRDEFDMLHRSQTRAAEKRAKSKWRERAKEPSHSPEKSNREVVLSRDDIYNFVTPQPGCLLRPSLHQLSLFRFYYDWIRRAYMSPLKASLEPLPTHLQKMKPDSGLYSAINAVAYANFGCRFRSPETRLKGIQHYERATIALRKTAGSLPESEMTDALLTTFLCSLYELVSTPELDGFWNSHVAGVEPILELRGPQSSNGFKNSTLSLTLYSTTIGRHITQRTRPPAHLRRITELFEPGSKRFLLNDAIIDIANLNAEMHQQAKPASCPSAIPSVPVDLDAALALQQRSHDLNSYFHSIWRADPAFAHAYLADTTYPLHGHLRTGWARDLFAQPGAPTRMYATDATQLKVLEWNFYRAAYLSLNFSLLEHLQATTDPGLQTEQSAAAADIVVAMVEEMLATFPAQMMLTPIADPSSPSSSSSSSSSSSASPSSGNAAAATGPSDAPLSPFEAAIALPPDPTSPSTLQKPNSDPTSLDEICTMYAYQAFWPMCHCLRVFRCPLIRQRYPDAEATEAWVKSALSFLSHHLGIAKAEVSRRHYEGHGGWFENLPGVVY